MRLFKNNISAFRSKNHTYSQINVKQDPSLITINVIVNKIKLGNVQVRSFGKEWFERFFVKMKFELKTFRQKRYGASRTEMWQKNNWWFFYQRKREREKKK